MVSDEGLMEQTSAGEQVQRVIGARNMQCDQSCHRLLLLLPFYPLWTEFGVLQRQPSMVAPAVGVTGVIDPVPRPR
jgi:hypothetical protein